LSEIKNETQSKESVSISKNTIYGIGIVILVALLTIGIMTGGFGLFKNTNPANNTTNTTNVTNTTNNTIIPGITQLSVTTGSITAYGQANALVTWLEFSDFQCPYCWKLYAQTNNYVKTNYVQTGKVKMYWKDVPLSFHDKATSAALAARCANEQGKFWEMHDKIFDNQQTWTSQSVSQFETTAKGYASALGMNSQTFDTCLSSKKYINEITKDANEAASLNIDNGAGYPKGILGTPGVLLLLPKNKTNLNTLKTAASAYQLGIYQDLNNYIVFVGGAYPYETFDAVLKTVTYS